MVLWWVEAHEECSLTLGSLDRLVDLFGTFDIGEGPKSGIEEYSELSGTL